MARAKKEDAKPNAVVPCERCVGARKQNSESTVVVGFLTRTIVSLQNEKAELLSAINATARKELLSGEARNPEWKLILDSMIATKQLAGPLAIVCASAIQAVDAMASQVTKATKSRDDAQAKLKIALRDNAVHTKRIAELKSLLAKAEEDNASYVKMHDHMREVREESRRLLSENQLLVNENARLNEELQKPRQGYDDAIAALEQEKHDLRHVIAHDKANSAKVLTLRANIDELKQSITALNEENAMLKMELHEKAAS